MRQRLLRLLPPPLLSAPLMAITRSLTLSHSPLPSGLLAAQLYLSTSILKCAWPAQSPQLLVSSPTTPSTEMFNSLLVFSGKRVSQGNSEGWWTLFSTMLIYQQARLEVVVNKHMDTVKFLLDRLGEVRDGGWGDCGAMGGSGGLGIILGIFVNILDWVLYQDFDIICCASCSDWKLRPTISEVVMWLESEFGFWVEN